MSRDLLPVGTDRARAGAARDGDLRARCRLFARGLAARSRRRPRSRATTRSAIRRSSATRSRASPTPASGCSTSRSCASSRRRGSRSSVPCSRPPRGSARATRSSPATIPTRRGSPTTSPRCATSRRRFGIAPCLEPMPWTDAKNFAQGARIVGNAARANVGLLIDPHPLRSRRQRRQARSPAFPRAICATSRCAMRPPSAPPTLEGLLHQARAERLLPGEGGLDLAGILRAVPADAPISIEIPMERWRRPVPAVERARARASRATRELLQRVVMVTLADIEAAARNVYAAMAPTPQYAWPLLAERAGCEVWVKHENHTPIGAFKVRGGLNLLAQLVAARSARFPASSAPRAATTARASRSPRAATACAARIVVPEGNSRGKNAAMRAFGADLLVHGRDFDEAREYAASLARAEGIALRRAVRARARRGGRDLCARILPRRARSRHACSCRSVAAPASAG